MPNFMGFCPSCVKGNFPIDWAKAYGQLPRMTNFRDQVIAAIDTQGLSVAEVARRAGLKYDNVRDLIRREGSSTSAEKAAKIAEVLGIDISPSQPRLVDPGENLPADSLVTVYDVQASAGHGALVDAEMEAYTVAFPPNYLRKLTSTAPVNLAIISVKGESMEPTLLDDDLVLLDTSKTNLSYDGLFVLRFDDALHVKRVGRAPKKGHVTIISDNSALYPPMVMPMQEIEPVGKVLWYGRKV